MIDMSVAEPFRYPQAPGEKTKWLVALSAALFVHLASLVFLTYRHEVREPDLAPPMALDMSDLPSSIAAPNAVPLEQPHQLIVQEETKATPPPPAPVVVPIAPAPNVFVEQKVPDKTPPVKHQVHKKKVVIKKTETPKVAASTEARVSTKNSAQSRGASSHVANTSKASWNNEIMSRLHQAKHYPARARWKNLEDNILALFQISADGSVQSVQILRSKGYAELDDDVSELVRRVGHVPPPPGGSATTVKVLLSYVVAN